MRICRAKGDKTRWVLTGVEGERMSGHIGLQAWKLMQEQGEVWSPRPGLSGVKQPSSLLRMTVRQLGQAQPLKAA